MAHDISVKLIYFRSSCHDEFQALGVQNHDTTKSRHLLIDSISDSTKDCQSYTVYLRKLLTKNSISLYILLTNIIQNTKVG